MNKDWLKQVATILIMVTGALTAYYTTVYGIRLTVNEKADRATVDQIDRRLVAIETILRTDIAHQSDVIEMRAAIDNRLTRIETLLETR
jgi:predicted small integral membrane protein